MGLFATKMTYDEAFAVLAMEKPNVVELKRALRIIEDLEAGDLRKFPCFALLNMHGLLIGTLEAAYWNLCHAEDYDGLTEELLSVLRLPHVFRRFDDALQSTGALFCAIYVARAYENGWGTVMDHSKAVEMAKHLKEVPEGEKFSDEAKKVYDEITGYRPKATEVTTKANLRKRFTYSNGDVYEGEVQDGKYHGRGKYTFAGGTYYDGDWVNGIKHGRGIYVRDSKGWAYEGDFIDGEMTGQCKITYKNGDLYTGAIVKGQFSGQGKYEYANGNYYDGEWLNGIMHGHGKFTEKSEGLTLLYEGEYVNGSREGRFEGKVLGEDFDKIYIKYFQADEVMEEKIEIIEEQETVTAVEDDMRAEDVLEEAKEGPAGESDPGEASGSDTNKAGSAYTLKNLRYLFFMKSSGKIHSTSHIEQGFYQYVHRLCNGDPEGIALSFVKDCVSTNDLSTLSHEDAKFCIYLLNEIIPRKNTRAELAALYYRIGDIDKAARFVNEGTPFGDEIKALRCLNKMQRDLQNSNGKEAVKRIALAKGYLANARNRGDNYRVSEISDTLEEMRKGLFERAYTRPEIDEEYGIENVIKAVFNIGQNSESGTLTQRVYDQWVANAPEWLKYTKTKTNSVKYTKRQKALKPLQEFLSKATHAVRKLRKNIPQDEAEGFEKAIEEYVLLAEKAMECNLPDLAFDLLCAAYDHGYSLTRLGKICKELAAPVLAEGAEARDFNDPYFNIMKIAAISLPDMDIIGICESILDKYLYTEGFLKELLLNEEYTEMK